MAAPMREFNHLEENCIFPVGHVFPLITSIFKHSQHINKTNHLTKFHDDWQKYVTLRVLLTKFHEDWAKKCLLDCPHKTAPLPGGHVFSMIPTIFKLNQDINKTNVLTKFYDDWTKKVTSSVFTSFKLGRGIIGTNVLTKFHEDWTIHVASRVFTRQNVDDGRTTHYARRTTDKRRSQKLTMSTLCPGELKRGHFHSLKLSPNFTSEYHGKSTRTDYL
ncbi:hypothetical protein DPMN_029801 [Dreissena polymorpha]|uniref:Uncharacterized protein n=1 Tax=Dreissena polymorpha TaxID=45954 RepID=A0A9D4RHH1_DREPO|nr:hypothetical protein DPMN_029801 [Dreissena polymorpha]